MEAFSDGVIAVIITIMVLELRVPAEHVSNMDGLRATFPVLLIYLLSFVQTGIYWVNHHYMVDDVKSVTHGMLWANLAFLFFLSLFPFAARWVGERGITSFSVALYSFISALPAICWMILATLIRRRSEVPLAGSAAKQIASSLLYVSAIPVAYFSPYASLSMLGIVAVLWLIPPQKTAKVILPHL